MQDPSSSTGNPSPQQMINPAMQQMQEATQAPGKPGSDGSSATPGTTGTPGAGAIPDLDPTAQADIASLGKDINSLGLPQPEAFQTVNSGPAMTIDTPEATLQGSSFGGISEGRTTSLPGSTTPASLPEPATMRSGADVGESMGDIMQSLSGGNVTQILVAFDNMNLGQVAASLSSSGGDIVGTDHTEGAAQSNAMSASGLSSDGKATNQQGENSSPSSDNIVKSGVAAQSDEPHGASTTSPSSSNSTSYSNPWDDDGFISYNTLANMEASLINDQNKVYGSEVNSLISSASLQFQQSENAANKLVSGAKDALNASIASFATSVGISVATSGMSIKADSHADGSILSSDTKEAMEGMRPAAEANDEATTATHEFLNASKERDVLARKYESPMDNRKEGVNKKVLTYNKAEDKLEVQDHNKKGEPAPTRDFNSTKDNTDFPTAESDMERLRTLNGTGTDSVAGKQIAAQSKIAKARKANNQLVAKSNTDRQAYDLNKTRDDAATDSYPSDTLRVGRPKAASKKFFLAKRTGSSFFGRARPGYYDVRESTVNDGIRENNNTFVSQSDDHLNNLDTMVRNPSEAAREAPGTAATAPMTREQKMNVDNRNTQRTAAKNSSIQKNETSQFFGASGQNWSTYSNLGNAISNPLTAFINAQGAYEKAQQDAQGQIDSANASLEGTDVSSSQSNASSTMSLIASFMSSANTINQDQTQVAAGIK